MHIRLLVIISSAAYCNCDATYEVYQELEEKSPERYNDVYDLIGALNMSLSTGFSTETTDMPINTTIRSTKDENLINTKQKMRNYKKMSTVKPIILNCPETEEPSNIGPYEVPTQKDLVLMITKILIRMFDRFNANAFYFLKDIKQVTRATKATEKKCRGKSSLYKKCVKTVQHHFEYITKNIVATIEKQKAQVAELIEGKICNIALMKTDPMELIKALATEEASLKFALPGFLRLLNKCNYYCSSNYHNEVHKTNYSAIKPKRHMTDQDLVVQHLLTRKNYIELINGV